MPKGKPIEPLDLEELESSPSLRGMLAFREMVKLSGVAPTGLTPVALPPVDKSAVPSIRPAEPEPDLAGPSQADVLSQLAQMPKPLRIRGKTIRAARVEDGHSATQDALYWFLWRSGKQVNGSRSRFVQAGYGQIQAGLGIDRSNVQDAIRELQKKFSLRIYTASTVGSATIYEVFCCEDILAKRRSEGLIWARRFGTRRADLLSIPDDDPVVPIGLAPIGASGGIGITPAAPVGLTPTEGIGVTPIHLAKEEVTSKRKTSAALTVVIRSVQDELGVIDDQAANRILEACYGQAPDATEDEVEHHVRMQASRIRGMKRIENPIGLLIAQIPRLFEGEAFRQFRETRRQQQERGRELDLAEEQRHQKQAGELRARLEDPRISTEEKNLIRRILG